MIQLSMTSMNETDSPSKSNFQTGSNQDIFRQTSRDKVSSKKAPLGVIEREVGPIKYVVPNQDYLNLSAYNKTLSPPGIQGSPRSTMYT